MNDKNFNQNRRSFFKKSVFAAAGVGLGIRSLKGKPVSSGTTSGDYPFPEDKNVYFGDIHNHNEIGQIKGSLERSFEIARSHLDFFSFTGQSQWPDMVEIPKGKNAQFETGFKEVKENWDKIKRLTEQYYEPDQFASFLGYEVHFNEGDFHIIFPGSDGDLVYLPDIRSWQKYAKEHRAVLIPHHPGYKPGWRGWDWSLMDSSVSPVVEICSEHGGAESDRSPIRYIRHSMGGRYTKSTVQWLWEQGIRTGVVASTDDHLGFPGAYGEGLAAVWCDSLNRESIMEAIKNRRTYGVNADRIRLQFLLNGQWMGSSVPGTKTREIAVKAEGEDMIDRIEVLKNNKVIHRHYPVDRTPGRESWNKPVLSRIEFGWGPWSAFGMPRICDWEFQVKVDNGKLLSVSPHLQSRPFDEDRRHRITRHDGENSCEIRSYTSRLDAFEDKPTNDVVLKIQGSPDTRITMEITKPEKMSVTKTLGELAEANEIRFTGAFSSESVMLHRIVHADNYESMFRFSDKGNGRETDWYYARVIQANESLAWSSPIWVG